MADQCFFPRSSFFSPTTFGCSSAPPRRFFFTEASFFSSVFFFFFPPRSRLVFLPLAWGRFASVFKGDGLALDPFLSSLLPFIFLCGMSYHFWFPFQYTRGLPFLLRREVFSFVFFFLRRFLSQVSFFLLYIYLLTHWPLPAFF